MKRVAVVVGAIALALVLSGCGGVVGIPAPRADAVPVDSVVCPETYEDGYAQAGAVPPSFTAVAFVRCDPWASLEQIGGTWSGARLDRFTGDLTPVLDALATPNDPASVVCPAIGYMLPELWFEDADGRAVRVALPSASCGPKDVGLDAAIATLTLAETEFVNGDLIESDRAAAAGCATYAGLTVMLGSDDIPDEDIVTPAPGTEVNLIPWEPPVLPATDEVTGARVCAYGSAGAPDSATVPVPAGGGFMYSEAWTLDAATAADALRLAASAPAAPSSTTDVCAQAASRLLVVQPNAGSASESSLTVELDGCQRLVGPDLRARSAPPELLALLTP